MVNKRSKGQSLFEIVIAMGILALIGVAVVSVVTLSVKNNSFSRNKTVAENYAQEALEWIRNYKNSDWTGFSGIANAGTYCLQALNFDLSGQCINQPIPQTIFTREVSFTPESAGFVAVISVSWDGGEHEAKISANFQNTGSQ